MNDDRWYTGHPPFYFYQKDIGGLQAMGHIGPILFSSCQPWISLSGTTPQISRELITKKRHSLVNKHRYGKLSFIVDFPIKHGDCPVRYVSLPEGTL